MKPPPDRFTIFVICDDGSHPKAQAVTNFVRVRNESTAHRLPGHHWDEIYPGLRKNGADSAVTLIDNERPFADPKREPGDDAWKRSRAVYELQCRKCRRPYQARLEKLFPLLDEVYAEYVRAYGENGVVPISLAQIAARMQSLPHAADTSE